MRVGIVCPYDLGVPGGVQQLVRELAERLRQAGDDVLVVGPGQPAGDGEVGVGATVTVRANQSRAPVSFDPRAFRATRRHLAAVDVIHVHEPFVPLVGWAGLWSKKPVVATFHADPAPWTRRLYSILATPARAVLGKAVVTAVSEVAASALPPKWGQVSVIPNAIDTGGYALDLERHPHRVAFLGRDDPRKGLDVLLAAWPRVISAVPEAELVVMGAERVSTQPSVRFLGRVSDEVKRRTLAGAAIYVAPNLGGESFGLVVAEGMAAGCAVIASDIAAFRPVLGEAGVLVEPGDVSALAFEIVDLLGDPERRESLGAKAVASAVRFDWTPVVSAYRDAYESALSRS